ncbi:MAG: primosomal protein N' [Desulfuromonas sp.]|nr:MAG: primosomal protein N' [Desulfuromonas sp.]
MTPETLVATVAVAAPLPQPLSYLLPEELQTQAQIGMRVEVPLGPRRVVGYLLAIAPGEAEKLKPISRLLDSEPLFAPELVPFFRQVAHYYRHPPGEVIRCALPAGLGEKKGGVKILREKVYNASPGEEAPRGERQRDILTYLRQHGPCRASDLRAHFPHPQTVLKRLEELGLIRVHEEERERDPFRDLAIPADHPVTPSDEQEQALSAITAALETGGFSPFLLHGVTGSGKTEVYLRSIACALAAGKQALVLVPEIALTPQLVGRFRARFSDSAIRIAVLHSGLSDGERYDAWRRIARGEAEIVIGARSAVFAPLTQPGIIVVDEEHEASYKQGEGFRYHARDLALWRGQLQKATVLLGSATPALTTYQRAQSGQTGYLPLHGRVAGRPLPSVEILDLRGHANALLAAPLQEALTATLERGEQALLLLNRRGYAPYLLCSDCGTTCHCPNCEITLTYHLKSRRLRCHYCDYDQRPPDPCPGCGGSQLMPYGAGTERVEEELARLYPEARLMRMDRDTTAGRGRHQQMLDAILAGEVDILIGTQMIAKGHDFPGVTLVGVVQADTTLNFPDFRSSERTFSLLTQVAGRAGRGERPGTVMIQTYHPEHEAILCAAAHDYPRFAEQELAARQVLGYPPFGFLVNLILAGNDPRRVEEGATRLATVLMERSRDAVEILGPAPCPFARLRGKSRMQILLKASQRSVLQRLLDHLPELRRGLPAGVALAIDVDPLDML